MRVMVNMYLKQIMNAIDRCLEKDDQPRIDLDNVLFVMEDDVTYDPPASWSVPRSRLIDAREATVLESLFDGGPSWIHGNLIISGTARPLISLAVGNRVGNPRPTINTSLQRVEPAVADC